MMASIKFTSSSLKIVEKNTSGDAREVNGSTKQHTITSEKGYKQWLRLEIVGLVVVIATVWGLLTLPIIFFYLPINQVEDISPQSNSTNNTSCSLSAFTYSGLTCRSELFSKVMDCSPNDTLLKDIAVLNNASDQVQQLINGLQIIGSPECVEVAVPFLCLYLFGGVCDGDGTHYLPTEEECLEISTGVCSVEWDLARSTMGFDLPDCTLLPTESCSIEGLNSNVSSGNSIQETISDRNYSLSCRDRFYRDQRGFCIPICSTWNIFPLPASIGFDVAIILCAIVGALSGIGILVVCCLRFEKVFVFPSVFVIYETIILLILISFVFISYFDRSGLYCSSRSILESTFDTTPFCVITGIVIFYSSVQLNTWWVLHVTSMFLTIRFPYRTKTLRTSKKLTYIHIACIATGLILPTVPVIAAMSNHAILSKNAETMIMGKLGFGLTTFPPFLCTGLDADVTFYSIILPNIVLVQGGIAMLILTIWHIYKQNGLFRIKRSKSPFSVGVAERKLLIVFLYFVVLEVVGFAVFSLIQRNAKQLVKETGRYFVCELNGHDPSSPCDRAGFERYLFPTASILSYMLFLSTPVVNVVYVVDFQFLRNKLFSEKGGDSTKRPQSENVISTINTSYT